jgi:hypothetical protein
MATITLGAAPTAGQSADDTAITTSSFTPATGDLLIAIGGVTGQASGGTFSDSQGLGWTQVGTALKNSSADTLVIAVANTLAANSSMTVTFTPAGSPTSTSCAVRVLLASGITRTGLSAILQSGFASNASSGTIPSAALPAAATTSNPCFVAGYGGSGFASSVTGWTARGGNIPTNPPVSVSRAYSIDSGFTDTTAPWITTVSGSYCDAIVELDASAVSGAPGQSAPVMILSGG